MLRAGSLAVVVAVASAQCSSGCVYYTDMDFVDDNINVPLSAGNAEECCASCTAESACFSWVFTEADRMCYLKGSVKALVSAPGGGSHIAGTKCSADPKAIAVSYSSKAGLRFDTSTTWHADPNTSGNSTKSPRQRVDRALTTITVDPSQQFQEIFGFGGSFTEATGYNLGLVSEAVRDEILGLYFGDPSVSLGYSLCRVHMNSCDFSLESYSCDDTPDDFNLDDFNIVHDHKYLLPTIKTALSKTVRPLKLLVSPWSPPAWMKSNGQMLHSDNPGLIADPAIHASWALFFSKFISEYNAEGVPIWGITPQNEPLYAANWEACRYDIQEGRDFIMDHLGPRMKSDHPDVKLIMYDHNRDLVQDWANAILSGDDPVKEYIDGTGFHWYTGNSPGLNLYENLDASHEADPSKFLLATEATYCPGVSINDWKRGEAYMVDILNDLLHWSTGWIDWNMVLDEVGGPNHQGNMCDSPIIIDKDQGTYSLQVTYYAMGHFSKYIDPGAKRIAVDLSQSQYCIHSPHASEADMCGSINWACQFIDCEGHTSCESSVLPDNADFVFDKWYHEHIVDGPSACDFEGAASLEGVQAVAFENPDGRRVAIVLNVGERNHSFHLSSDGHTAPAFIAPRSIQSIEWTS